MSRACLGYDGKQIEVSGTGEDYADLLTLFGGKLYYQVVGFGDMYLVVLVFHIDDERKYAYVRIETGDEMSRRAKFAFITWIGPSVSPLKKAKVSTDKAFVKQIWPVS